MTQENTPSPDILDWMEQQPSHVKRNMRMITNVETLTPYLVRIDLEMPKQLYPRMPLSGMSGIENFSVPRISMAQHLAGCISGYSRIASDYSGFPYAPVEESAGWKSYYQYDISIVNFDFAIIPNSKLVPDANYSNEVWLVTYDKDTIAYKPKKIGTMTVFGIHERAFNQGKSFTRKIEFVIELTGGETIYMNAKDAMNGRYYRGHYLDNSTREKFSNEDYQAEPISKSEYQSIIAMTRSKDPVSPKDTPSWAQW